MTTSTFFTIVFFGLICLIAWVTLTLFRKKSAWAEEDLEIEEYSPEDSQNWDQLQTLDQPVEELAEDLQEEIYQEWEHARSKFGPFHSAHEGFAVLHEEFDELKAEVWSNEKKNPERTQRMRAEAVQVAAMALRFLTDVCHKD